MKQFLKRLLIFAALFFVIDKLFYVFIYLAPNYQADNRMQMLLEGKINKEIIILGSSRGAMNIIASQLEKQTGKSAYNISFSGSDVTFHDFVFKTLLKYNQKPKTLIIALDAPAELSQTTSISYRLDLLYPLTHYNYINEALINKGDRNFTSWFLCLSRLNKNHFKLKKEIGKYDSIMPCGSMPVNFKNPTFNSVFDASEKSYSHKQETVEKKEAFKSILKRCQSNGIKVIFVLPPNFHKHNTAFEKRMRQFEIPNSAFFIYDTLDMRYKDASNFHDESHLNLKGAKIFTNELSNYINLSH